MRQMGLIDLIALRLLRSAVIIVLVIEIETLLAELFGVPRFVSLA